MITKLVVTLSLLICHFDFLPADCSDGKADASDLYTYARKSYRAENLAELRSYAKKARVYGENTRVSAARCKCEEAVISADNAILYSKRAENETSFEDAANYAKKAFRAAEDVETALEDCDEPKGRPSKSRGV